MRRALLAFLTTTALLLAGTRSSATPLTSATWSQSLPGVDITVTAGYAACTPTGANLVQQTIQCPTASGLNPSGSAQGTAYTVSLTLPSFALTQYRTGGVIDVRTVASLRGGPLTFAGNGSAVTLGPAIQGMATVRVAGHATKGVNASLLTVRPTTLVQVPLSIGKAGRTTGYFYVLGQLHYMTVDFYAWTPNSIPFTGLTTDGAPLPDLVAMGSVEFLPSPKPSEIPASHFVIGHFPSLFLTLVAPSKISIDGPFAQRRTASFTSLKIGYLSEGNGVHGTMLPEPGTLLLLGAGTVGLVAARRR